jgi:hypothetical protein
MNDPLADAGGSFALVPGNVSRHQDRKRGNRPPRDRRRSAAQSDHPSILRDLDLWRYFFDAGRFIACGPFELRISWVLPCDEDAPPKPPGASPLANAEPVAAARTIEAMSAGIYFFMMLFPSWTIDDRNARMWIPMAQHYEHSVVSGVFICKDAQGARKRIDGARAIGPHIASRMLLHRIRGQAPRRHFRPFPAPAPPPA